MTLRKSHQTLKTRRYLNALLIIAFLLGGLGTGTVGASADQQALTAEAILEQMTPQEKVGQLFLITFEGNGIDEDTPIYDLIINNHIGGLVLRADQDNFIDDDTLNATYTLTSGLQRLAWQKSQPEEELVENSGNTPPAYVPLFIGIAQEGNGAPSDQILNGLTTLPSALAIGATWNPDLARQNGQVLGEELSALGFNLFLGPSLDVAGTSSTDLAYYSGTSSFGGDPYWVGELGKAYIGGLHEGSTGKLTVIAKHFPGQGGADRPPEEEVATVRKSLEQLKQLELAPFFSVTGNAGALEFVTDGLMISHIRYQGFQGNIRATTRPVSFDATALSQLMALETISGWRAAGGLIVSDSLGSRAVRRFFDPTEGSFDALQVARTAFLAGNDLLYLNDIIANGDDDEHTTILRTVEFFTQKYTEDPVFAQRVDSVVLRILNAKLKMYGSFEFDNVIPDQVQLAELGDANQAVMNVAREAITLISPGEGELDTLLPNPPTASEYIVIFTDVRANQQCSSCTPQRLLSNTSFQTSLLRLYGSAGSNQIFQNRLSSYTFGQLLEVLNAKTEPSEPYITDNLKRASWVIFNILDLNPAYPDSVALQRILSERVDLLKDKHVVVFAYDTPFYLDATAISKVTAYYGLFSRAPEFVDVAVRALMQEINPQGALPVSVSSVGYDLILATSPDPNQVIPLNLVTPEPSEAESPTAEVTENPPVSILQIGENVQIQTGIIVDRNQNPVPDGTVVRFTFRVAGENIIIQQQEATTLSGKATISYHIDRGGTLEVTASSEPATTSGVLILNIESGIAELIMPTQTPMPTATPTRIPTFTPVPTETEEVVSSVNPSGFPNLMDWFLALLVICTGFGLVYLIGYYWWGSVRWGLRSGLCAAIGGLVAYLLLNLGFPGLISWMEESGTWFVVQMAMVGVFLGWIAALIWWVIKDGNKVPPEMWQ